MNFASLKKIKSIKCREQHDSVNTRSAKTIRGYDLASKVDLVYLFFWYS